MRVIAGTARSMPLRTVKGLDVRPTTDRTKETLFNILMPWIPGCRFLDLYAGSGALALEALSRGAASAVLCDKSREAARVISANITSLKVEDRARLMAMSDQQAVRTLQQEGTRFDLVFLDPPYRMDTVPACKMLDEAQLLLDDALIVIEHAAESVPVPPECFRLSDRRRYRDTMISFYRYKEEKDGQTVGVPRQL